MKKQSNPIHTNLLYRPLMICLIVLCIHIVAVTSLGAEERTKQLAHPPWISYPYESFQTYPPVSAIDAEVYFVLDMNTGYVLSEYNGRKQHSMASLVKLMTAFIIIEDIDTGRLSLEDTYTVSDISMFNILPYDASRMGLALGQVVSIDELLKGLLVLSGNDAAILLATISRGNRVRFIEDMNTKADVLGLSKTHFADTTGLSPKNISTAEDIATLSYAVLSISSFDITNYTSIKKMTWHGYTKKNTNLLLSSYDGIDGLKTGYISEAGFNFVGTAQRLFLDGYQRRVLAIVMGVRKESMYAGVKARAKAVQILLDYAFDNFTQIEVSYPSFNIEVYGAKGGNQFLFNTQKKHILLPDKWIDTIYIEKNIEKQFVWASLREGEKVGHINIMYKDSDSVHSLASLSIYTPQEIEKANIIKRFFHFIKMLYYKIGSL